MQKLLRRTDLVKRQAARKALDRKNKLASDLRKSRTSDQTTHQQTIIQNVRQERIARRQDWIQGPLAPRRDVGEAAKTYGAVDPRRTQTPEKTEWKPYHIVVGDRVVVTMKGHRDRGKIGVVQVLNEESETCVVKDVNMAMVTVPDHMLISEQDKSPQRPYTLPIPLSGVRLVAKLPNPETGLERDVVVNELTKGFIPPEERIDDRKIGRFIAGLVPRTFIPYPKEEPEVFDDHPSDTLRLDVEERTFTPTLYEPPMPPTIINELRNRYGKFRTRHDPEYLEKVQQKERNTQEEQELLKLKMITPIEEFKMKERARKEAEGEPEITPETLAMIGEVMARSGLQVPPSEVDVREDKVE